MPQATLYLRPLSAETATSAVIKFLESLTPKRICEVRIHTNIAPLALELPAYQASDAQAQQRIDEFLRRIKSAKFHVDCRGFHIKNPPQSHPQVLGIQYFPPDAQRPYAQIQIDTSLGVDDLISVINAIGLSFDTFSEPHLFSEALPQASKEVLNYQQTVITELREQVEKIAAFNLERTKALEDLLLQRTVAQDESLRQREDRLEGQFEKRREDLDEAAIKLAQEYGDRTEELEKREEEHKRKIAEFDAKENMIVRRKLLTDMIAVIEKQKSFELSLKTGEKRRLVHILCSGALVLSGLLITVSAHAVLTWADPHWFHFTPLSAGILFFVSTAVYYIKWNDQWFREHARAEFQNKKLNADILRASWLAELYFEGNDKDRKLPEALVNRFSEGLFLDAAANATEHPTDQLVDLVKKLSTVKVGKEGVEVTKSSAKES